MRRLIILLLALLTLTAAGAQTGQPEYLKTLVPDSKTHDFGTVYERDGKVRHTYVLTNRGTRPVVISEVNTWCGCVAADYTRRAVRPGEQARVTVTFDPDHKQGNFVKQVVLLLNGGQSYVRLWVKANVVPMVHPVREDHPYYFGHGLYMSQQLLPFPELEPGRSHAIDLKLANDTDRPMTVTFRRVPNNTVLKMPAEVRLKPRQRTTIRVSYAYFRRHAATCHVTLYPVVNGRQGRPLTVRWNVGQKFRLLQ